MAVAVAVTVAVAVCKGSAAWQVQGEGVGKEGDAVTSRGPGPKRQEPGIPRRATGRHLGPARGSSHELGTACRRDQDAAPPPRRTSHSQGPGHQCGRIAPQPLAEGTWPPGLGSGRSSGRVLAGGTGSQDVAGPNTRETAKLGA